MANTFELIASSTVGAGGASSISFSSIPSTYTDLVLELSLRSAAAGVNPGLILKFNSVGTGYSSRNVYGTGSAAGSYSDTSGEIGVLAGNNATANVFGNGTIYITNYASSNYKSFSADTVNENNATSASAFLNAGLWSNTAAISSIQITEGGANNFLQYSTAYLYGVKNA
jgi:hypothetical protein